jgi:hypothetical protein
MAFQEMRQKLINRVRELGLPKLDAPFPLVTLEEFFEGNDDSGSAAIGCNLMPPLHPRFFYEKLKEIRSRPDVEDALVEIIEVEEQDLSMWPFSDRVDVFTKAPKDQVAAWGAALRPDTVDEGFTNGKRVICRNSSQVSKLTVSGGTREQCAILGSIAGARKLSTEYRALSTSFHRYSIQFRLSQEWPGGA